MFTKKRNYFKFRVFHFISPCDNEAPNKSIKESYQPAHIHFEKVILWKMFEMELKLLYKRTIAGKCLFAVVMRVKNIFDLLFDARPFQPSLLIFNSCFARHGEGNLNFSDFFHQPNEYFITFSEGNGKSDTAHT